MLRSAGTQSSQAITRESSGSRPPWALGRGHFLWHTTQASPSRCSAVRPSGSNVGPERAMKLSSPQPRRLRFGSISIAVKVCNQSPELQTTAKLCRPWITVRRDRLTEPECGMSMTNRLVKARNGVYGTVLSSPGDEPPAGARTLHSQGLLEADAALRVPPERRDADVTARDVPSGGTQIVRRQPGDREPAPPREVLHAGQQQSRDALPAVRRAYVELLDLGGVVAEPPQPGAAHRAVRPPGDDEHHSRVRRRPPPLRAGRRPGRRRGPQTARGHFRAGPRPGQEAGDDRAVERGHDQFDGWAAAHAGQQ